MINRTKAHIFNIDNLLIRVNQKVWIIDKSNPNECLMRVSKEDFDLIKSGVYKSQNLSMTFNGRTYWLSQDIFDKVKKVVRNLTKVDELSFSFREYTDPETIQDNKIEYDLSPIEHLKNTTDDIFFVSTKGTEKKYGHIYTVLIDKLREIGLVVKQTYYLNQSYFSQSKDQNIKKLCYLLISNLVGKKIYNDKLTEELNREYGEVHYYDSNYVTINKIKLQINSFLKRLEGTTNSKLILNLVGSNLLNPFTSTEVHLNKYIQTFEGFSQRIRNFFGFKDDNIKEPIKSIDKHIESRGDLVNFLEKSKLDFDFSDLITIVLKGDEDFIEITKENLWEPEWYVKYFKNMEEKINSIRSVDDDDSTREDYLKIIYDEIFTYRDLIMYISKHMARVISTKYVKKINEKLDISDPITPENLETFFKRNNIGFTLISGKQPIGLKYNRKDSYNPSEVKDRFNRNNTINYFIGESDDKYLRICFSNLSDPTVKYKGVPLMRNLKIPIETPTISFIDNNRNINTKEEYLYSFKDIIDYISKYNPSLVSKKIIKKINK